MLIGIDASRASTGKNSGTENYSYQVIKHLSLIDQENRYLLYFREAPLYPIVTAPNFTSKVIKSPYLWTQARLAWECLINPPDVLFVPAHTLPIVRRPSLKTVVTIHDLGEEYLPGYHQFPQKYYLSFASRYASKNADRVIAVSEATKTDLTKRYQVPNSKISVVYEGVDQDFFQKVPSSEVKAVQDKYALSGNYVFFLGTIQPRKNLERLIASFALVVKELPNRNLQLVIAGGHGWLNKDIYSAPIKEGITDQVKFLGYVPDTDLPALYSGASIFAYPSLFEGFGLPLLEAFSSGTPVLTSNVSSLPELAGEAALLVDPSDTDAIAAGLKRILTETSFRQALIEKGLKRAKEFSWEKAARETLKVLTSLGYK